MGDKSPFRTGFLKVAIFIDGVWVQIAMTELGDDGVTIKRGREREGQDTAPSSCTFRVKDPTGKWNNRHPSSVYFGKIGRGTPVRVQVEMTAGVVLDRWYGEVVRWQPKWTKKGAKSAHVEVECAGVMRRLGQGSAPLQSPLRRTLPTLGTNLVAYWPMEDEVGSTRMVPAVGNGSMVVKGAPSLAAFTGFAASDPLPTAGTGRFIATVPPYTPLSPAKAQIRWMMSIPSGAPNNAVLARIYCSGTLSYVELRYESANSFYIEGFDVDGSSAGAASGWLVGGATGLNQRVSIELTQSGANVSVTLTRYEVGAANGFFQSGSFNGVTLGKVTSVQLAPTTANVGDIAFGHLTVEKAITDLFTVSTSVLSSYDQERADDRISRLCTENGLTFGVFSVTGCALMGPQRSRELLDLIKDAARTDGGMLYEPRSTTDLGYRTLESLYSQTGGGKVSVAYVENMLKPFEPVEDDEATRNRVTVAREGGSSTTYTEADGPLGTDEVGVYDDQVSLSLATDADTAYQAQWRVHVGTTDEARWPTIGVDLADTRILADSALRDKFLNIGLGTLFEVTDIPDWLPPFSVQQIVQGYTEVINPLAYKLEFNCTPGRPYNVLKYDGPQRLSGKGTTTPALTTTQTTFTVVPPARVIWTHADGDYDITVNGEQMTVTDVVGNLFTVIRSVNGVVKTHLAGSLVELAEQAYYGL